MSAEQVEQFWNEGYVILRQMVPPLSADPIRAAVETIVVRNRQTDPTWDTTATARSRMTDFVDAGTVQALEFALHENTFDVSAQLLRCPVEALGLTMVAVLCNPEFEPDEPRPSGQRWGTDPRNWHRDVRPDVNGPLEALIADDLVNGPSYAQWNIALYDDAILHMIPGSHRRLNSEVEVTRLNDDEGRRSPLAGNICADLKAGDGIVYSSMALHWGSRYTNRQKRRTLHFGYRSFGHHFPYSRSSGVPLQVADFFVRDSRPRQRLEQTFRLYREESKLIEGIFRAVLDEDREAFRQGIDRLHPNRDGQLTCLILLTKAARDLYDLSQAETSEDGGRISELLAREQLSNLGPAGVGQLWQRLGSFDDSLRTGETKHVRGFLGTPTDYAFEQVPAGVTFDAALEAIFGTQAESVLSGNR